MDVKYLEIWKDIVGYEKLYQVSNLGRVRSYDREVTYKNGTVHVHKGRILKTATNKSGYLQINLYRNGTQKVCLVHRLVAMAFLPNPDNLPCVNHKDENRSNSHVDNLEWCTHEYNSNYSHTGTKANKDRRKQINCYSYPDMKYVTTFESCNEAARQLGVSSSLVSKVANGKKPQTKGYYFEYI